MSNQPQGVFARQARPGAPIEVGWWGDAGARFQFITDLEAQRLVADLSKAILANAQEIKRQEVSVETAPRGSRQRERRSSC